MHLPENFSHRHDYFIHYTQYVANREGFTLYKFEIDRDRPFGGIIGRGNSCLDRVLSWSKIMRLHAIVHDSHGYLKSEYGIGPGYSYVINLPWNSCLLGHVSGVAYLLKFKLTNRELYRQIDI